MYVFKKKNRFLTVRFKYFSSYINIVRLPLVTELEKGFSKLSLERFVNQRSTCSAKIFLAERRIEERIETFFSRDENRK